MNYLHYDIFANSNDIIRVDLDHQANVILLDDINYNNYVNNRRFRYIGGLVTKTPYHLRSPHNGHWNIVIDTAGRSGNLKASVRVIKGY